MLTSNGGKGVVRPARQKTARADLTDLSQSRNPFRSPPTRLHRGTGEISGLGRRYRWSGPLEGADAGGLETFLNIATHLLPELAKGEGVLETLQELVGRGEKDHATGRGIYVWDSARNEKLWEARARAMRER